MSQESEDLRVCDFTDKLSSLIRVEQCLVKIVKAAQLRQIKGKRGDWNDFVANVNKKRGGTHSDPAKHPVDVLASFVQTFSRKEDVEVTLSQT